jgi:anti-sigma-K factor RskA
MTGPTDQSELLSLATPYALHALSDADAAALEQRVAAAPPDVAEAFVAEVRAVRETMAALAAVTALEPPPHLRAQVLRQIETPLRRPRGGASRGPRRWTRATLLVAAVAVVALGALGVGYALRPAANPTQSTAGAVFAAPDVRSVTGEMPGGGQATVVFSRERHSGVLVMNNVPKPQPGTVYQMWLIDSAGPHSAGTMDAAAVAPSTTAVLPDLGSSRTLAFTVEPQGGSTAPTSPPVAQLPLV